jgi:DeoR/GlpR family transcriptional regulator of sugar metabolism
MGVRSDPDATASKFRRRGLSAICLMNAMGRVITDRGINPGTARELERQGVQVTAA